MPNVPMLDVANKLFILSVNMLNFIMLGDVMLDVANKLFMLSVIILNVVLLTVLAPIDFLSRNILALQLYI